MPLSKGSYPSKRHKTKRHKTKRNYASGDGEEKVRPRKTIPGSSTLCDNKDLYIKIIKDDTEECYKYKDLTIVFDEDDNVIDIKHQGNSIIGMIEDIVEKDDPNIIQVCWEGKCFNMEDFYGENVRILNDELGAFGVQGSDNDLWKPSKSIYQHFYVDDDLEEFE